MFITFPAPLPTVGTTFAGLYTQTAEPNKRVWFTCNTPAVADCSGVMHCYYKGFASVRYLMPAMFAPELTSISDPRELYG